MNVILYEAHELHDCELRLSGRRAKHLATVLRCNIGDTFTVGEIDGAMGRGTVRAVEGDAYVLTVEASAPPPEPLPIELLLAVPRPKVLRRVLQAVASMGIKRLVLVGSYRVDKSYYESPLLEPAALREELLLGLEQGRDTQVPEVELHRFFKPFVEDVLEARFPVGARLLAEPGPRQHPPLGEARRAVIAIGPEGGWTEYELRRLGEYRFAPWSAGPRPLRVETAVPFLVGQVALAMGA